MYIWQAFCIGVVLILIAMFVHEWYLLFFFGGMFLFSCLIEIIGQYLIYRRKKKRLNL